MHPLIGITDFTNFEQVETMFDVFKKYLPKGSNRKLHVGVMMSYKTLNDIKSRWQKAFPPKEKITEIFSSDEVYNCLHYVDYRGELDLPYYLSRAISYGGIGIHAVQLDMIWPDPGQVADAIHRSRKHIEVILQIGKDAFENVNQDPQKLIHLLEDYEGVINRVLLDKSMGRGYDINSLELLPFLRAIRQRFPKLGLIVAGGLGPMSLDLLGSIPEEFPDVSIDAQGRLRASRDILDPIDWSMAEQYLINALKILG